MALGWIWWRAWSPLVAWDAAPLCVSGVKLGDIHRFSVASVALGDIHLRFVWQAWRLVTSTFVFPWQALRLVTSTFVLCGRRGAW